MDNAVGSLTQFQKDIIIGCVLGDGYLRIFPGRKNALLEINHSVKAKYYVEWKYSILKNIAGAPPKIRKCNGKRLAYRFYTKQLPELTVLWKEFYQNNKKIIPHNLILNPVILSVWFMDDGCKCGKYNFYLNTQQYNIYHQKILIEKLKLLGLETTLNKDKCYWRIRFKSSSIPKLKQLISDKIIPSMRYKLG